MLVQWKLAQPRAQAQPEASDPTFARAVELLDEWYEAVRSAHRKYDSAGVAGPLNRR